MHVNCVRVYVCTRAVQVTLSDFFNFKNFYYPIIHGQAVQQRGAGEEREERRRKRRRCFISAFSMLLKSLRGGGGNPCTVKTRPGRVSPEWGG